MSPRTLWAFSPKSQNHLEGHQNCYILWGCQGWGLYWKPLLQIPVISRMESPPPSLANSSIQRILTWLPAVSPAVIYYKKSKVLTKLIQNEKWYKKADNFLAIIRWPAGSNGANRISRSGKHDIVWCLKISQTDEVNECNICNRNYKRLVQLIFVIHLSL